MNQNILSIQDWRLLAFFVGLALVLSIGNYFLGLAIGKCSQEYLRPHRGGGPSAESSAEKIQDQNPPENEGK